MHVSITAVSMHSKSDVTGTWLIDRWHQCSVHKAMRAARLSAGPEICISTIGAEFLTDFVAPEMVTVSQLFDECENLEDLDGHTRNVVAADAWAVGATVYHAGTGSVLVAEHDQDDTSSTLEAFAAARLSYLQKVHAGWGVSQTCHPG